MEARTEKEVEIHVKLREGRIDMGEKYAYAVEAGATIKWVCAQPLAILLEWDAPFEIKYKSAKSTVVQATKEGVPNRLYKYGIAVFDGEKVLTLDPVLVFAPPRG
ncbi:MAG: hypothetical protein JXO51_03045 [Candidatus Aminicenantes bacterium]|nr:hypothetical protein [Candidatus Aminicenantes bacterium]